MPFPRRSEGRLAQLAALGVDLRPLLRRIRDRITAPLVQQLSDEAEARRQAIDSLAATLNAEIDERLRQSAQLRQAITDETEARQTEDQRLRADAESRYADKAAVAEALAAEAGAREGAIAAHVQSMDARLAHEGQLVAREGRLVDGLLASMLDSLLANALPHYAPSSSAPRVSVIMPVRDRAGPVRRALASLQSQTMRDWEAVVVSDGSTDGTVATVETLAASDPRIKLLQLPASGVCAARNHGLAHARGDIVAYLDSDNRAFPDYLAEVVSAFDASAATHCVYAALVSDGPYVDGKRILCREWNRDMLLAANFIDLNVFSHRRSVYERLGGFDEGLTRLVDWDLVLRYTEDRPPTRLLIAGVSYNTRGEDRVSRRADIGRNRFLIQRKWLPRASVNPRVLYAIQPGPELDWACLWTEVRAALRAGVKVEVWLAQDVAPSLLPDVPLHRGALDAAIERSTPDLIHVHRIGALPATLNVANTRGIAVTVRADSSEGAQDVSAVTDPASQVARADLYPYQAVTVPPCPWVHMTHAVFDTELFVPPGDGSLAKDRRTILHAVTAASAEQIELLVEAARRLPEHRFVLAVAAGQKDPLDARLAQIAGSHAAIEVHPIQSQAELASLMAQAGIYLHLPDRGEPPENSTLGMPTPIAAAMACGAIPVVPGDPALIEYVDKTGTAYANVDELAARIIETQSWDDQTWHARFIAAIDRAFEHYADDITLHPLFETWRALAAQRSGSAEAAG
ncbi:Glycosyltransferase involved in cell wall bisynthesis [Paraburkholderia caballeronis]|uniref:Glycosyltransferase involved in cell wall bisynthesis n=1 Tax=Paraburkholderia caballeronis TaxID=416943 RepID=A0A1H7R2G1_9BURK|nr:glycosyltransferase involved in cell wall biosynthesis [Paraburkholderia caballeronis]PXW99031.1 glycosyltransferase involved in cell wall biosynthesis [Paraburkholderia caballeronis]RAJ96237.1 glycosyltransferase involved in cell wall biosynthesis [Paraburkholderia caballeronis]SEC83809.1 Glycosyltransferase involved in cell wall bisynthesis [Paraburkholderia caballeronis]SEL54451.1 Glycosyltransferase involved in cell wall bisynthesis [Paraburkholderia caballeronis]